MKQSCPIHGETPCKCIIEATIKEVDAMLAAEIELSKHDDLSLLDKLSDCQQPKWERLLRDLVKEIKDA